MSTVELYSRKGCKLCDEVRAELVELRSQGHPFELLEVDIEEEDGLLARYLERIPVVAVNGEEAFELVWDREAVLARLATVER